MARKSFSKAILSRFKKNGNVKKILESIKKNTLNESFALNNK